MLRSCSLSLVCEDRSTVADLVHGLRRKMQQLQLKIHVSDWATLGKVCFDEASQRRHCEDDGRKSPTAHLTPNPKFCLALELTKVTGDICETQEHEDQPILIPLLNVNQLRVTHRSQLVGLQSHNSQRNAAIPFKIEERIKTGTRPSHIRSLSQRNTQLSQRRRGSSSRSSDMKPMR